MFSNNVIDVKNYGDISLWHISVNHGCLCLFTCIALLLHSQYIDCRMQNLFAYPEISVFKQMNKQTNTFHISVDLD